MLGSAAAIMPVSISIPKTADMGWAPWRSYEQSDRLTVEKTIPQAAFDIQNNYVFVIDTLEGFMDRGAASRHRQPFCRRVTMQTTMPKRATNGGRRAGQLFARNQLTSTSCGSCRRGVSQLHCCRRVLEDVATRAYADDQAN